LRRNRKTSIGIILIIMVIISIGVMIIGPGIVNEVGGVGGWGKEDSDLKIKKEAMDINKIWEIIRGGNESDKGYDIAGVDGKIYVACETNSIGNGEMDAFILKYDVNGTEDWNLTWGGIDWDGASAITVNGSVIYVTGYTKSYGNGNQDLLILKIDKNGTIIWNITWGGPSDDAGTDIIVDGAYIYVVGGTTSYGAGGYDVVFMQVDINGNIVWNKTWGGSNNDYGYGIANQSQYIYMSGITESFGAGALDAFLIKYYKNGTQVWNTTWGGTYEDWGGRIYVSGPVYLTGKTRSFGTGSSDIFLVKFSPDGEQVWNATWGGTGNDFGSKVMVSESKIYIIGTYNNPLTGSDDAVLLKFHDNGTVVWNFTWDNGDTDWGFGISILDFKIYICGFTRIGISNNNDVFIIKLGIELIPPILEEIRPLYTVNSNIELKWNKIYAATSYKVFRSNETIINITGLQYICNITENNYVDILEEYGTYFYVVIASNSTANSSISNCINITYIEQMAGPNLILLSRTPILNPRINLTWSEINNTKYYIIYRSTRIITDVNNLIPIAMVVNNTYNDTLPGFGVYYYTVVGVLEYTNTSKSNTVIIIYIFTEDGLLMFGEYLVIILIIGCTTGLWYYNTRKKYSKKGEINNKLNKIGK